jgi:hypothetical protein
LFTRLHLLVARAYAQTRMAIDTPEWGSNY